MQYADFFAGWAAFSVINAGLAEKRRRSRLRWGLLSLLLGPLATFLILVLPAGFS